MKIAVCVKQIQDPEIAPSVFRVDEEERRVIPLPGLSPVINPFDEQAVEAALRIRDAAGEDSGIEITVVTIGPRGARAVVKAALALGADNAVLLSDPAFDDSDGYATARTLAETIRTIGDVDLILTGRQAADWGCRRRRCRYRGASGTARHHLRPGRAGSRTGRSPSSGCWRTASRRWRRDLPAVVTISNELGAVRYASLRETMRAARKPIVTWAPGRHWSRRGASRRRGLASRAGAPLHPRQRHRVRVHRGGHGKPRWPQPWPGGCARRTWCRHARTMADNSGILVVIETADGQPIDPAFEMLGLARRLAGGVGGAVTAVALGTGLNGIGEVLGARGADRILIADDAAFADYQADAWLPDLARIVTETAPAAVLIGHTVAGTDLAPRLAFRLDTAVATGCEEIEFVGGRPHMTRVCFGGNAREVVSFTTVPAVATIRAKTQEALEPDPGRTGETEFVASVLDAGSVRTRIAGRERERADGVRPGQRRCRDRRRPRRRRSGGVRASRRARPTARRCCRRQPGRLRSGMVPAVVSNRPDRAHGGTRALSGGRDFRRRPAHGRLRCRRDHRLDQLRPGRVDLPVVPIRRRRRLSGGDSRAGRRNQEVEGLTCDGRESGWRSTQIQWECLRPVSWNRYSRFRSQVGATLRRRLTPGGVTASGLAPTAPT